MKISIGRWLIEGDPETTRRCYAKIPWGHDGDCAPCRNLDALGPAAFPAAAHAIFEKLGIDLHKPAEVYHTARLAGGLHLYGDWYHCVGHIESGPQTSRATTPSGAAEPFSAVIVAKPRAPGDDNPQNVVLYLERK
jgi:hypothetical protein